MDLAKFDFPCVTGVDQVFPVLDTLPELLAEAKARGFYQKNTPPIIGCFRRYFTTADVSCGKRMLAKILGLKRGPTAVV